MIQAVIFDLDGTLIDTEPAAARAIVDCFKTWNIQVEPGDAAFITGRTWEMAFQFLFKKYELPVPAQHASREIMNCYRKLMQTECFPVPGSAEAVKSLAPIYPLALVSGSYRAEIHWALEKLKIKEHFKVILGAEDYPRSKPAPDGYLKAFDLMNLKPETVLIFEDSEAGIASAKAAGARVVAITGTNHFSQNNTLADHFLPDLTAVTPAWIKGIE
jgi:beta-phosphoglucomutase-like phosphatase (HAD superfamily)